MWNFESSCCIIIRLNWTHWKYCNINCVRKLSIVDYYDMDYCWHLESDLKRMWSYWYPTSWFMLSIPFIVSVNKVYWVITSESKNRACYLFDNWNWNLNIIQMPLNEIEWVSFAQSCVYCYNYVSNILSWPFYDP